MASLLHHLLNWNKKSTPETVDAEQYAEAFEKFKALLLEQYQLRLQTKTAKRLPINLSAKSTDFGMDPDRARAFLPTQTIESQDIAKEIDKILHTHDRLLIIGDPGAGKTTILLFAAINILMDKSQEQKLPLILNLATWQTGRDFKEWYAQSVAHTYCLSLVFAEELLRRNAVVPFFDGFDEVAEDAREDCLQKMAAYFGDQRSRQFIVSSRKKEYASVKADPPVYAEFEVQPLSLPQIKKALSENAQTQAADRALLDAIERDEHLAKAVETPFYLNTASFLFAKGQRTWKDFSFNTKSTEGRQNELVEFFLAEQVPGEQDRQYLGFLAGKMETEKFLVFELVKVQPKWSDKLWKNDFSMGLVGSLMGALIGILATIIYYIWNITTKGVWEGLSIYVTILNKGLLFQGTGGVVLVGLSIGFFVGYVLSGIITSIQTEDIHTWRWSVFVKNWKKFIVIGSISGFIASWVFNFVDRTDIFTRTSFGLTFGVLFGVFSGFKIAGTSTNHLLSLSRPYIRFWVTYLNYFWLTPLLIFALFCEKINLSLLTEGPFVIFLNAWIERVMRTLYLGLFVFFILLPVIFSQLPQHFAIRIALVLQNKLPLRLVTFLDRMSDQYILEDNRRTLKGKKQRGATWRFRHKILQDYFAGLSAEPSYGPKP